MRIKSSHQASQRGFWLDIGRWFQSRTGLVQLLLAVGAGFVLAVGAAICSELWKEEIGESPIRSLFAEAEDAAENALGINRLPTLYFDIGR
jgi:hypothetical protein